MQYKLLTTAQNQHFTEKIILRKHRQNTTTSLVTNPPHYTLPGTTRIAVKYLLMQQPNPTQAPNALSQHNRNASSNSNSAPRAFHVTPPRGTDPLHGGHSSTTAHPGNSLHNVPITRYTGPSNKLHTTSSTPTSTAHNPADVIPKTFQEHNTNHKNTTFCTTGGALSSYLIIEKFEDTESVHCPEMTFFQNALAITHKDQGITLTFNTADAILGTILPLEDENQQHSTSSSTTTTKTSSRKVKVHPHFDAKEYLPDQSIKCKDSTTWQKQSSRKVDANGVPIETSADSHHENNWMFASVYQGDLIADRHGYFDPATNAQTPDTPYMTHLKSLISPLTTLTQQQSAATVPPHLIPNPQHHKNFYEDIVERLVAYPHVTANNNDTTTTPITPNTTTPSSSTYWEVSDEPLDYRRLTNKDDKIVYYNHVILYEDELHDNGVSRYSIRIRAMESCYYILVRNFIRVDDVTAIVRDTRYMYVYPVGEEEKKEEEKKPDYLWKETKVQSVSFDELKAQKKFLDNSQYTEDKCGMMLPVKYLITERLDLNKLKNKAQIFATTCVEE